MRAQVCQFNNATCGSFQALTQRGYLTATVKNTGAISGGYFVEVQGYHFVFICHAAVTSIWNIQGVHNMSSLCSWCIYCL